jgi:hypothetical protein
MGSGCARSSSFRRHDPRVAMVGRRRASRVPSGRSQGEGQAPICSASAAPRARARAAREGVPLNIIQRQLGHTNLGTSSIYLQGSPAARGPGSRWHVRACLRRPGRGGMRTHRVCEFSLALINDANQRGPGHRRRRVASAAAVVSSALWPIVVDQPGVGVVKGRPRAAFPLRCSCRRRKARARRLVSPCWCSAIRCRRRRRRRDRPGASRPAPRSRRKPEAARA